MGDYEDLFPKRVRLLFYDVETAPMLSYHWAPKTEYIREHLVVDDDRAVLCWSAKWSDDTEVIESRLTGKEAKSQDDSRIVGELADLIREADYVVAHNGNRFDYKRVNTRLLLNSLTPLGDVQMVDTLLIARQSFDLPYNNLEYLAQKLGFDGKHETSFELWRKSVMGHVPSLKTMSAYCSQDVILLEHVFHAMAPYAKRLPRLVDATEWRQELCPYCGSQDREISGTHRTKMNNFRKFRCLECRREYRGWQAIGSKKMGSA